MRVKVANEAEWTSLVQQLREHGGVSVRPDKPPAAFSQVAVAFEGPAGLLAALAGTVVHLSPDGLVSVVATDAKALEGVGFGTASSNHEPQGEVKPLWATYDELSKHDKLKLAQHGNVEARRLILKDRDQTLHPHLLNNPGITAGEVAALVRSGGAGPAFIARVAARADLLGNPQIAEAIVMNPQTPVPLAVQLIAKLPIDVVRRIAKAGNLRMPIVSAARKRVIVK